MCIQLGEQVLAISEELRRFEMAMLTIVFLVQALHGLERVAQVGQVLFHHHRADAKSG